MDNVGRAINRESRLLEPRICGLASLVLATIVGGAYLNDVKLDERVRGTPVEQHLEADGGKGTIPGNQRRREREREELRKLVEPTIIPDEQTIQEYRKARAARSADE